MIEGHTLRRHRDLAARHERQFIISGIASALGALGAIGATAGAAGGLGSALGTIIPAVGAASAAAGTGYAISAGQQGKKMQQQALSQQTRAQDAQAAAARNQQARSQMAMAAATRPQPNMQQLMQQAGPEGSSTMLTGPMGVNPQELQLGRSTLLGA